MFSRLALGSAQFGLDYGISNKEGKTQEEEVGKILERALECNIRMIDTASEYGNSEYVLGKSGASRFNVVTKLPAHALTEDAVVESIRKSHSYFSQNSLYGLLVHNSTVLEKHPEIWQFLMHQKEKGTVKKIGVSVYTPDQLVLLMERCIVPDIVQLPYNVLDKRFEFLFSALKSSDVEIHTRSVFLQGLFFIPASELGSFFEPVREFIAKIQQTLKTPDLIAAWLIKQVLKNLSVDKVIFGVNNLAQLNSNIESLLEDIDFSIDPPEVADNIILPYRWPQRN